MRKVISWLERLITGVGRFASLLILPVIGLLLYEIIARAAFNEASSWAHEVSTWLITGLIFLGGPYALLRGQFVRVDILFNRLPARAKAIIDTSVSTVLFGAFVYTLIWLGGNQAVRSIAIGETSSSGTWAGPVWAAKLLIPVGAFLLALAWIVHLYTIWRGETRGDGV